MFLPEFVKKVLSSDRGLLTLPNLLINSKWMANRCNSLEDYVNLAFSPSRVIPFPWITINPSQIKEEITAFLKILARCKLRFVLEIGTAKGGTLFLFTRISMPKALIISIDLPSGQFGGGYPDWKVPLYKSFTIHEQKMYLIRKDSHAQSTLDVTKKILNENKLDLLFIDGNHTYNSVQADFEMYSGLVRKGGIISFHDIVPGPSASVGDVPRFWNEIKHSFHHFELVKNWKQGGCGIGIIYMP